MPKPAQLTLFTSPEKQTEPDDWTFNGASTRELTHCYHDYPARMIPQIAGKLLDSFGAGAKLLFDLYSGTGTSLVEGMIRGINVIGTDLNPLARLIAGAKTSIADLNAVDREISKFSRFILDLNPRTLADLAEIPGISRLDFWFKPEIARKLRRLREFIDDIRDESARLFFQVAFSETVRESSNTRNDEFKLYRYAEAKLEVFSPDVFGIMSYKLHRNRKGLQNYLAIIHKLANPPTARICAFDTVIGAPKDILPPSGVDIVITSPPYGDSHTTVAYGQYSRLSAAWLGLEEPEKVDAKLMGGRAIKAARSFPSVALNSAIERIAARDAKRATEVSSFYSDLQASIVNVAEAVKPGGCACYVVGNRKVKGVVLPTDAAIRAFFENCGFNHRSTFKRTIPNKRMPSKNSPTNASGAIDNTMTEEYIVVMQRPELQ